MDWRILAGRLHDTFSKFSSELFAGDGFSVRIHYRYGLTYCEGERRLTLMTGDEDRTDRYGRTWLVFPTIETQIFVPNYLLWDDGQVFSDEERTRAIKRICNTFDRRKEPYRVVIGNEIYDQLWQGMQATGKTGTS